MLLLLVLAAAPASAAKQADVDYLALAALLTRDGEFERAAQALANVDPAVPGTDLARFHTVRGLLAQEDRRHADAADAFATAAAAGEVDPLIHLYRAQALFQLERYGDAVAAIEAAGDAVDALSGAWLMRAHAQWMLGRRQAALDTLAQADQRFPDNPGFQRRKLFYLIDAGLFLPAADVGRDYLRRVDGKPEDYVAIGTALRRARQYDEALRFLEAARIAHPSDGAIVRALAQTWLERGNPLSAAELLAVEAERDPALLVEAAELFRRAGHLQRALALNSRVADSSRKLKQRVGLLLAARRYEQVIGLESALARAGLFADEDVRYALAYAHYSGGSFEAAETHLAALTRPDLFRRATELRRLMLECRDARWTCA
jgi:thioredoxin-like negative regulator of GroEL